MKIILQSIKFLCVLLVTLAYIYNSILLFTEYQLQMANDHCIIMPLHIPWIYMPWTYNLWKYYVEGEWYLEICVLKE